MSQLRIEIRNKHPIEVSDFARSMLSVGAEYQRFLSSGDNAATPDDVKLFITEVRSGSIIATLTAIAPAAIPFIEHAESVIQFASYLKTAYEWLKGDNDDKPVIEKNTLQNLSSIVEPVAKDNGSQLIIGTLNVTGDLVITSKDANAIQNRINREIDALAEPVSGLHEQVVMYWAQARGAGQTGDKVRIESIHSGDVKVRFVSDAIKAQALHQQPFPFKVAFLVDVVVETIRGKPVLYKVTQIHEVIANP